MRIIQTQPHISSRELASLLGVSYPTIWRDLSELTERGIIRSDDKKRARLNCIRYFLHQLDYPGKDVKAIGKVDDKIVLVPDTRYKEKTIDIGHD